MADIKEISIKGTDLDTMFDIIAIYLKKTNMQITSFQFTKKAQTDKKILVFCTCNPENSTPYPLKPTIPILKEHARQYLSDYCIDHIQEFFKEDLYISDSDEIGYEIFTPDWYSDEHGLSDYSIFQILAVQPILIQNGK